MFIDKTYIVLQTLYVFSAEYIERGISHRKEAQVSEKVWVINIWNWVGGIYVSFFFVFIEEKKGSPTFLFHFRLVHSLHLTWSLTYCSFYFNIFFYIFQNPLYPKPDGNSCASATSGLCKYFESGKTIRA